MSLGMGLYCVHFVYLCVRVIVGGGERETPFAVLYEKHFSE